MTRLTFRPTLAVSALLVAASTIFAEAHEPADARGEGHASHHVGAIAAGTHAAAPKQEVYYRPFCRRSHYVTSRAVPCW